MIAGLVMFFSSYLLRFDATSTFGIMGAFFANVSLMCNLTGILNCLFMGFKLSAGKGSVYEAVDVLQGVGQTVMLIIFGANVQGWLTCSTPSTSRPMTTCVGPALGSSSRFSVTRMVFVIWYFNSYEPLLCWHSWSWTYELFKPMFIIAWLRMGRVPTREEPRRNSSTS